jgi:hypothetical protein
MPQLLKDFKLNKFKSEKLLEVIKKESHSIKVEKDNQDKENLKLNKVNKHQKILNKNQKEPIKRKMLQKEKLEEEDQEKVNNDLSNRFHYFINLIYSFIILKYIKKQIKFNYFFIQTISITKLPIYSFCFLIGKKLFILTSTIPQDFP